MLPAMLTAVLLAATAGAAAAQTIPRPLQDRFWMHDASRQDQQRLGDQLQVQALTAAQARLRTQQSLQALELARPPAPFVPDDYPASSSMRRGAREPSTIVADPAPPTSTGANMDAQARGDLPL